MDRYVQKRSQLEQLLGRGVVLVQLDARQPGVQVPKELRGRARLGLNLSYQFPPYDLEVTRWGFSQTLSFGGKPCLCRVPWSAVYAFGQGESESFWVEDMPGAEETDSESPAPYLRLVG